MKENKRRKQDAGGVGRCGGKGDPDLSFTNDFFSEIYHPIVSLAPYIATV